MSLSNSGEIGEAKFRKLVAWKANVVEKWREGEKHGENKDYNKEKDCKFTIYIHCGKKPLKSVCE